MRELVAAVAPRAVALLAVSTQHAAQLLITVGGNPHQLRSDAAFAALCAADPIPASCGKTTHHRLNRAGDRDANATLHMIAVPRLRWALPPRPTPHAAPRRPVQTRDHPLP